MSQWIEYRHSTPTTSAIQQPPSWSDSLVGLFPQTHDPTVYPRASHIVEFQLEAIYNETDTEALITRGRAAHYIPQTYLRLIPNRLSSLAMRITFY